MKIRLMIVTLGVILISIIAYLSVSFYFYQKEKAVTELAYDSITTVYTEVTTNIGVNQVTNIYNDKINKHEDYLEEIKIVYKGMTRDQLIAKIEKNLNSTVKGKGHLFVDYSLQYGVDPYLAVSIMLLETGCNWECSYLTRICNNYGGQKGGSGCNGGSYASFSSPEEGIKAFIRNIANNYVKYGLTTAETMASKYATSSKWAQKVNAYYDKIERS